MRNITIARDLVTIIFGLNVFLFGGCQISADVYQADRNLSENLKENDALSKPVPNSLSAHYLIARHALYENDLSSASNAFQAGLALDETSESLLKQAFFIHYQNGALTKARQVASILENRNISFPLSVEPAIGNSIIDGDWQAVLALATKLQTDQLYIGLAIALRSFAYAGQGEFETAIAEMEKLSELMFTETGSRTNTSVTLLKAILAELSGHNDEAIALYEIVITMPGETAFSAISSGIGLARLGKAELASVVLRDRLSSNFNIMQIDRLLKTKYSEKKNKLTLRQAFSTIFLLSPSLLPGEEIQSLILPRTHLAYSMCEDCDYVAYRLGQNLANLGDIETSFAFLQTISAKSPWAQPAFLIKINALDESGRRDDAISLIDKTLSEKVQSSDARASLAEPFRLYQLNGNLHRYNGACDAAIPYYLEAERLRPQTVLTMRGLAICYEQTDNDIEAERLFRAVLEQTPNDALTLNYLGYWWADDGRKLDEAIELIKKAVALRPSSGFYADSLGWVYYRLGRMDEAIEWLETAIQLAPTDAIISDHLADAYWAVGRRLEASYKWQHALNLGLGDTESLATQKKLEKAMTAGVGTVK